MPDADSKAAILASASGLVGGYLLHRLLQTVPYQRLIDIVERTPYGRDVMRALADECRRQGIKLFFYYSQLDWHQPDPPPDVRPDTARPRSSG